MSTFKKDSKQYSNRPQLVTHYINACQSVYGVEPFIHRKLYSKFSVFEDDLREEGISPKDYAYVVAKLLEKFVYNKGLKCITVNLFLGDYCLTRYKRVKKTKTVEIRHNDIKDILLHDEVLVARVYIEKNSKSSNGYYRLCDIVDELKPLLSSEWLQVYNTKGKRPQFDALEQLCEEYNISKPVTDYFDIVSALR